ncbi:MAG TPA: NRDE family protein [Spongiibacteraceae bacterium]|nr:NRDE family protein [Spongiibacteraceae bacterium]
MCLILFAVDSHPQYSLVVAANRDEYYARPTRALQPWPEAPQLLAGKDLNAGGTWLGLTRRGRFAAVTNARDGIAPAQPRSRGALTLDFLLSDATPRDYAQRVAHDGSSYAGFNLLIGDRSGLYYCSNGDTSMRRLDAGIYGIANASLDTPWPKVESGKADLSAALQGAIDPEALLRIIVDQSPPNAPPLPDMSGEAMTEHLQTTRFISSTIYGTRAATALLIGRDGIATVWEQSFDSGGVPGQLAQYQWQLDPLA